MKPLFVPLRTQYFREFEAGTKTTEYRRYGPRWNERCCVPRRPVVLSHGYSGARRYGHVAAFSAVQMTTDIYGEALHAAITIVLDPPAEEPAESASPARQQSAARPREDAAERQSTVVALRVVTPAIAARSILEIPGAPPPPLIWRHAMADGNHEPATGTPAAPPTPEDLELALANLRVAIDKLDICGLALLCLQVDDQRRHVGAAVLGRIAHMLRDDVLNDIDVSQEMFAAWIERGRPAGTSAQGAAQG